MSRLSGKRSALIVVAGLLVAIAGCATSGSGGSSAPVTRVEAEQSAAQPMPVAGTLMPPVEVPEEAALAFNRALAAMAAEDLLTAQIEFDQLTVDFPAFAGPYVNLAILYRRDNRPDEAEAVLNRALAVAPDHPAANNELGVLLRERGDFVAAEAAYRQAIAGDPGYALAHYNLGVLLDLYLKREAEALDHYEQYQSLALEPDDTVGRWIIDLRRRLGLPAEPEQLALEVGP